MSELSLESAYIFYATYHHDHTNKWIHIFCIWPIFVSGIVLFYLLSPLIALLITIMYASYYAIVEQPGIAGPVASTLVCFSYFFAFFLFFRFHLDHTLLLRGAALIHVCGWLAQFYGHTFHEGRAPALLTNLYQALMMAPLFGEYPTISSLFFFIYDITDCIFFLFLFSGVGGVFCIWLQKRVPRAY